MDMNDSKRTICILQGMDIMYYVFAVFHIPLYH